MTNKAIVAKVDRVEEIPGANTIQVAYVLGERVIVGKDITPGYIGILFPAGLQLSEEYVRHNNLSRHSENNADPTKKGFFDDNRKVRAQKFMKVQSDAYFADLKSLNYIGILGGDEFFMGMQFDELHGQKICQKFISQQTLKAMKGQQKIPKQALYPNFEKHVDTEHFKYYVDKIEPGSIIYFHSKRHGTSFRSAYTEETKTLNWFQKLINRFLLPVFKETEWKVVTGTRNVVIGDDSKADKVGFHGPEQYRFDVTKAIEPYLEKGMTVYGEIFGFVNGGPIMPRHGTAPLGKEYQKKYGDTMTYSYGCKEHEYKFHIYRITRQTVSGEIVEMPQRELEKWCDKRNLPRTLEVRDPVIYFGNSESLAFIVDDLTERFHVLSEDFTDPTHLSEGIILRIENGERKPLFLKSKSWAFKVLEGLEEGVNAEDLEAVATEA